MTMGLTAPAAGALTLPGLGTIPGTDGVELPSGALADLSPTDILGLGSALDLGGLLGLDFDAINGITDVLEPLGINLVTTGPPFGLAALFGLNLGYVPALPPLIVDEVTSTEPALNIGQLLGLLGLPALPIPNGVRIPIVVGFGLGALATGLAYPQIRDYFTSEEQRDTLTILPLLLLRNWGRADGGIAARFAPLLDPIARLFGYESVVTPDVENDADYINLLGLDIPVGGLVPIKVDATWEYDTFSDFPAWPNPVSLANSVAAGLFPTYILRGGDVAALTPQLAAALPAILAGLLNEDGAINIFLTVPSDRQPILEPFRYPFDVANFFTGGAFGFTNPFADAVEPAIKILGNLGYTNVVQHPTQAQIAAGLEPYDRDFSNNYGQDYAPFFTFPQNVDWAEVPEDVLNALVEGFTEAFFFGGIPGVNNPPDGIYRNPIDVLGDLASLLQNLPALPVDLPAGTTTEITADGFTPPSINDTQLRRDATQLTVGVTASDEPDGEVEESDSGDKDPIVRSQSGPKRSSLVGNLRDAGEQVRDAVEDSVDRLNNAGERLRNTLTGGRANREPAADTEAPEKQETKTEASPSQDD
ncbi:alpha/beta hydrolase family protein [Mycolicibacterium litorale]|nr:PE-PPE domain-containing protein [Mycolicibacterium litorale]MCV7418764.1 PE-PPE domain-containing protein [Mycolicibacterium litorale]